MTITGRKDESSYYLNNDSYKRKPFFASNLSGPRKTEPSLLCKKSNELIDMDHQKEKKIWVP